MLERGKRKSGSKNNTGLYQARPNLSTRSLRLAGLERWLVGLLATRPPHVWRITGPLGAGKTTLVQSLAKVLGVSSAVTSPTFALQKIFPLRGQRWNRLVHIDAYRLTTQEEIAALELDQYLADPLALVVVEWPERLSGVVWGPAVNIKLAPTDSGRARDISVTTSGEGLRRGRTLR